MKKSIMTAIAVAATMLGTGAVQAQTAPPPAPSVGASFDVNLNLTSACIIADSTGKSVTALSSIDIDYTAFQTTPGTGSTSFVVRCSEGVPISSIDLDTASLTDGKTGLAYTLALKTTNAGNAKTPVASLTGQTGTAAGTKYFVQAFVPSGQAGINTPGTDNKTRTVTVTY